MKRLLVAFIICVFVSYPAFSKNSEKADMNLNSFSGLGRYINNLEINDTPVQDVKTNDDNVFELDAITDIYKRYESNSIELKLDDIDSNTLYGINASRIFSLKANETQYRIEHEIKTENMIWDSSKSFSQAIFSDSRHMAPIPSVINSQKLNAKVSKNVAASLGQTNLYDSLGPSLLFVRANESTYNMGSVLAYKGDKMNISIGSFSSSYNHSSSGGAIISSKEMKLPKQAGSFILGGGYFANEMDYDNKTTGGLFGEYTFKRLKFNAQIGQSKFTHSDIVDTSVYFVPEYKLTKSLSLKTRFIRNVTQHSMQDELVLSYKPFKNKSNLEVEINASNHYTDTSNVKQRLKLSTSFKI